MKETSFKAENLQLLTWVDIKHVFDKTVDAAVHGCKTEEDTAQCFQSWASIYEIQWWPPGPDTVRRVNLHNF